MTPEQLRELQAPFKEKYRNDPETAQATLIARGNVNFDTVSVSLEKSAAQMAAPGMHPMAGGDGSYACAAEMLLEALIGCAGVTLAAVCTAMEIPVTSASLVASGKLDFRGTLGVNREAPVGFQEVHLNFVFDSPADDAKLAKAVQLAERYCVVAQSLKTVEARWERT